MPSPLLQLRIPQDLADWLEAKHPSRGEVAEYVRQLLTAEQMKEAVAPLVPVDFCGDCGDTGVCPVCRGGAGDAYYCSACANTHKCFCLTGAAKPATADAYKAEPKPKARRKKKGEVGNPSISLVDALTASVEATAPIPCECGGKIYQLGTRKGQCSGCGSPKPLKESK